MKKLFTFFAMVLMISTIMAQVPQKFTYQAVVRNANGQLVSSLPVGVRISILSGSASGIPVYVETQTVNTNQNGLFTLSIGDGTVSQGTMSGIAWNEGPFYLKTEIDPNGGTAYSVASTQQLLSVPYALYANQAGNGFSGNYSDLSGAPNLATVATTGNYNDLTNTPVIPTVPTNVSAFQNDAGYITLQQVPAQPQGSQVGDLLYWNGSAWVVVPAGQQGQQLVMNNGVPTWQNVEDHSFYYINFDANGGSGFMNAQFFPNGISQNINTNTFTRRGYLFTGWNTASDGSGVSYDRDAVISLTGNITLYAQWSSNLRLQLPTPCGNNGNGSQTMGE